MATTLSTSAQVCDTLVHESVLDFISHFPGFSIVLSLFLLSLSLSCVGTMMISVIKPPDDDDLFLLLHVLFMMITGRSGGAKSPILVRVKKCLRMRTIPGLLDQLEISRPLAYKNILDDASEELLTRIKIAPQGNLLSLLQASFRLSASRN